SPARRAQACLAGHMLNRDAPDHRRLRRMATGAFAPRRVDALRPRIEQLADSLLTGAAGVAPRLADGGTVDLVDAFAFPLPVLVIAEVLGVPEADRAELREWTYRVGSPADALPPGAVDEAWGQLHAYFSELIAHKRRAPGDDLFSDLVAGRTAEGPALDGDELVAMAFLLLFAGYETTMNLLASASLELLARPAERAAARAGGPPYWAAVAEETLRHASPLEGATWRRTTERVELGGGVVLPERAPVLVVLAAANRDPARFPEPDAFRPARYLTAEGRRSAPHLAFGYGPHVCLGARLARLEAAVALPRLFAALPDDAGPADTAPVPYRPGLLVRGPRSLRVRQKR
ncbi:cytochrome P450, partial [Streptomyces boncukensis]